MQTVSVVIPAHNSAAHLAETLESILSQESATVDLLVVDDGSTDETVLVARSFGQSVRVIEQSNSGVCAARNRGLSEAKGEFVCFVDHDDVWLPGKLRSQLEAFDKYSDVDVVYTDFLRWSRNSESGEFPEPSSYQDTAVPNGVDEEFSGWIYHHMLLDSHVLTSTALARTVVVRQTGGFDETLPFSEDWDFWLRMSLNSKFLKLAEATTLYRQHPTQGSRVTRAIDYRTLLLKRASRKWGLCSRDGRCVELKRFRRQLAKYETSFGLGHLRRSPGASRYIAARAFLGALRTDITYFRSLLYLVATPFGWTPKW